MKEVRFLRQKHLLNILKISIVLLISLTLIFSTTLSIELSNNKNIEFEIKNEEIPHSLAPEIQENPKLEFEKSIEITQIPTSEECPIIYAYNAYPGPEGTVYFDVCNCTIEECGDTISGDFLTGGTLGCDNIWYATQYGSGILYGIDPYNDCEMWCIGGGGTGILGLAYDPITHKMYGSSDSNYLYEIYPDTGEQDQIGYFGGGVMYMVGLAFDAEGTLYGWDLNGILWSIDTETGEATQIGPLPINYASDGEFHKETNTLYFNTAQGLLAINEDGYSIVCDTYGIELTCLIVLEQCPIPDHDVSISSIDYPESGYAIPDIPMQVTVKNGGNNTETTDVQMQVIKYEAGPVIFEEDFSDAFPPEGWETDYWNISYTNVAGGSSPEAKVNKYYQHDEGDYYDNYITSAPIDCSGLEKVNLRFRWAADYEYPQYSSVYIKFRGNSTSPWKNITPWDNPIGENQDAQLWDISCYGYDEPLGDEFQVKWEYIGYYYYFNDLWLDDVEIVKYISSEDYNETVEDLEIEKGEELIVEFPTWTPTHWQNPEYENIWKDYRVSACTLLEDDIPDNNCLDKLIDLYYPWIHDIEVKSIDSPSDDGPGKTYPVKATIKNVGQFAECCIPIDIKIGESLLLDTLLLEDTWDTVPPEGWQDEHESIGSEYGWRKSNTFYSGGFSPEAYIPYYYCWQDYKFYSYAVDTSDYQMLNLKFLSYINHYHGQGLYALEAGYSSDGETWYTAWHEEPDSSGKYVVDVTIEGGSPTTYIGFWVKGNPYYFNYWYIDDVELVALGYIEEYYDYACQGPDIEPGEEVTLTFEDWTPEFLSEGTTGTKEYIIEACIDMDGDKNKDNDNKNERFSLDFWHDVGIDEVTSPVGEGHPREGDEIHWDNGEPDGRNALPGSMYQGYSNILIDDFFMKDCSSIQGGCIHLIWNEGYTKNTKTIIVYFFADEGDCDPSLDEYPVPDYVFEASEFTEYTTGAYYFSRPEVIVDFRLSEEAAIPEGKWYIGIQPDGLTEDIAYILTTTDKGCMAMADLPYWDYPRWTSSQYIWGQAYDLSFEIHGGYCGGPSSNAWIQPGTENIDAIIMNYGTFPKEGLTCYAEIKEYITDPENGTQVYTDEISNIDLTTPLGGTKELNFADFTFEDEGHYGLFLDLPSIPDDEVKNNQVSWGIAVDDTSPDSDYPPEIFPPDPDGLNGWYVTPPEITLKATDQWSHGVSSGVKEFRITLNGGTEQVFPGNTVVLPPFDDGEILLEYWAVDWVGNVETQKNAFTVKIDGTKPDIKLSYEVTGGNPFSGWELTFTATATDGTSGIDHVDFYLNDFYQETVTGPEPTYEWALTYRGGLSLNITAIAYDKAGNFNSDYIEDPTISASSKPISTEISSNSLPILKIPQLR